MNPKNLNYEGAAFVTTSDGEKGWGYKLATIRGLVGDTGVIEDVRFAGMNAHDMTMSKEMLLASPVLKQGDILLNDRGFLNREVLNQLKTSRGVDMYIPLKTNMHAYLSAVRRAKSQGKWRIHPKRREQRIAFVSGVGPDWESDAPENDVDLNACVVWDTVSDHYAVFVTTDLTKSASMIIKIYGLRPEIEEDYRQLKDFRRLEDFKSTKLNVIAFHIVCVLLGYLFSQLYTLFPDGEKMIGRSLPVAQKRSHVKVFPYIIIYADECFGVFSIFEIAEIYRTSFGKSQEVLGHVLKNL